jgi:predicted unusual protein kinase regulating ubiquinone biosynthesis (AarF/ABC1/UbiB family)
MLRSGTICTSFLYNYLTGKLSSLGDTGNFDKRVSVLHALSKTLENQGGVLSKLSQLICLKDEKNRIFSDCKPFSKDATHEYFISYMEEKHPNVVLDTDIFKSGSVGQVYKGTLSTGENVIFKVQYVGLEEQTEQDLHMLDMVSRYVYNFVNIEDAMIDIRTKMNDELNYQLEIKNQNTLYQLYNIASEFYIPKVYREFCTDDIICMEYVEGRTLDQILTSSQAIRDKVGTAIVKFIFDNLYNRKIFYSDIHYGNFLVKHDNSLCIIDFGCIHDVESDLHEQLLDIHRFILQKDKTGFYRSLEEVGIINSNISTESKEYIYQYFSTQYQPWNEDKFNFTEQWYNSALEKNVKLMSEWKLPSTMVYFNKIPYALFLILTKLRVSRGFRAYFESLLNIQTNTDK